MGRIRDGAPDEWDCLVFTAVWDYKTRQRAADHLKREYDESITLVRIGQILKGIDDWLGKPAFEPTRNRRGVLVLTPRGKEFLRFARKVTAIYQEERRPREERSLPKIVCFPQHVYITSRLECALREEHARHGDFGDQILVEELAHSERSDDTFEDRALLPLALGQHDIAIGSRTTEYDQELQSDLLYTAHLEAMVHVDYEAESLALADLISRYRAMLPPEDARSRKLLESWIERHGVKDPGKERRVAAETYEIMMSVQRVSDDHRQFGSRVRRVVVVPSDVALLYKPGSCFGGSALDTSKWVPIQHDGKLLELDVFVTTTNPRPMHLRPVVERIKDICNNDPSLAGGVRASVPRQRPGPGGAPPRDQGAK